MQVKPGALLYVEKPFRVYWGLGLDANFLLVGGDYILITGELTRDWRGESNAITRYGSIHLNELFLHNWYLSEVIP